ncbi:TVP38/TMEM64 family protein [Shewanella sp. NIFS-20-20]|uniref:TVP38/TMEM64 family protein n=1 Tax=Shewanella sp. NIFS-20-20 TaxID=2853806 RepID=UPI001C48AA35|nr:VTT domain-containing protein [Shewanella sp. NIFS-20-20]MBV7317164.1 VTT domain-containing protein [Shewanella sp. NIFS-20-20]
MKWLLKAGLLFSIVMLLILAEENDLFSQLTNTHWLSQYIQDNGHWALFTLSVSGIAFTAIGGPRQLIATMFGFCYGGLNGAIWSTGIAIIGALLAFYSARFIFKDLLEQHFQRKLDMFNHVFSRDAWIKVMTIRLLPVGSNLVTNLLAGSTRISATSFTLGSLIGYLPQMLIFSFIGAGISFSDRGQLMVSLCLIVLSVFLIGFLRHRRLKQNGSTS